MIVTMPINFESPDVQIPQSEITRLLRWPADEPITGDTATLVDSARRWYAEHGQPWRHARVLDIRQIDGACIVLSTGLHLTSHSLAAALRQAKADQLVVLAATAGTKIVARISQLWKEDQPDLSFVLDAYGSAVVEHLICTTRDEFCAWADRRGQAVLHHLSPGHDGWDLADQHRLHQLVAEDRQRTGQLPIDVLDSGLLKPLKSQLIAFGLTRRTDLVQRLDGTLACTRCSLRNCDYRRAPAEFGHLRSDSGDAHL